MTRAVTLGESMAMFRSSEIGKLETKTQTALGFGGAESNVAIGLAKFGIDTSWISRLGDDPLGSLIRNGVRGQGVHLYVEFDSEHRTGLMIRETPRADISRVYYYRDNSAASKMQPRLVERFDWQNAALFHTSGITSAISDSAAETVLTALQLAKAAGAICSYDINFRSKLLTPGRAGEHIRTVLPLVDYLFGSEDEILLLGENGESAIQAAKRLATDFGITVVVKRAERGALAITSSEILEHVGKRVKPVDPVGAGDAFVAGFLAKVLQQESLEQALRVGHEFAALSVLAPGDWESQPDPQDLFKEAGDVVR